MSYNTHRIHDTLVVVSLLSSLADSRLVAVSNSRNYSTQSCVLSYITSPWPLYPIMTLIELRRRCFDYVCTTTFSAFFCSKDTARFMLVIKYRLHYIDLFQPHRVYTPRSGNLLWWTQFVSTYCLSMLYHKQSGKGYNTFCYDARDNKTGEKKLPRGRQWSFITGLRMLLLILLYSSTELVLLIIDSVSIGEGIGESPLPLWVVLGPNTGVSIVCHCRHHSRRC